MSFDSLGDLMYMSGHGGYVWASYALGLAVLLVNLVRLTRGQRQTLNNLRRTAKAAVEDK